MGTSIDIRFDREGAFYQSVYKAYVKISLSILCVLCLFLVSAPVIDLEHEELPADKLVPHNESRYAPDRRVTRSLGLDKSLPDVFDPDDSPTLKDLMQLMKKNHKTATSLTNFKINSTKWRNP